MEAPTEKQKELLRKLGELPGENRRVFLHRPFFKSLTDDEFKVFWQLPFDVHVGPRTRSYVEKRSKRLDLKVTDTAGFDLHKN